MATSKGDNAGASAPATIQPDPQKEAMFACIQDSFKAQGLNPITSPLNQIVWSTMTRSVITKIGQGMRKCMKTKLGKDPGDLIGALLALSAHQPVMTVATLIADLEPLVTGQ
ncbi:MAG TPA: hypothetical protein VJZ00_14195 [Thermoanaerobaculia bacterium]|nr:hypothetical protein [Thermoanaerobaculia bacterium]